MLNSICIAHKLPYYTQFDYPFRGKLDSTTLARLHSHMLPEGMKELRAARSSKPEAGRL